MTNARLLSTPLLVSLFLLATSSYAIGENAGDINSSQTSQSIPVEMQIQNTSIQRNSGQFGSPSNTTVQRSSVKVFGERVFDGGFSGIRADNLNEDYKVSPGDRVIFRAWGSINIEQVLTVDAKGNIFIPNIGPVHVEGVTHSQLETKVTKAVKTIYTDNVQVYTQLQGTQPVGVFVTGFVNVPGKYAGTPNDSILYFLHQANGIDKERGSFRKVKVIRDDKEVAQLDLYDFVLSGRLPKIQFQEGDTVVVERRGKTIDVVNADKIIEKFEIAKAKVNGGSFLDYYPLKADISHALIKGARQGKPFSDYVSLAKFQEYPLDKDDQVMFMADEQAQSIVVQLEGSYLGKSYFVVPKTTTLQELLDNVAVQPELTDIDSISIRRLSVAQKQKEALLASLDRLENVYLTANSSTAEEASIRIKEAELIQGFVSRASKVEPNGRLVVATKDGVADVGLQDGDVVTIPAKSESVLISGQVLVPRTIVFQEGLTIEDYIKLSGGFTEQADEEKIVVIRQSGEVIADATAVIKPGDQILVLPEVPTKNIQLATSITQILYQIAIAAKVAFDL